MARAGSEANLDRRRGQSLCFPNMPFNTEKDLDPVQLIGTAPYVLSTNSQKPFKTLAEVVAAAKTKPGTLSYATVGAGRVGHLAMELLWKQAGVRLVHVPYRGCGPAMNDLIAGHVDLLIASTGGRLDQSVGTVRQDPDLDARECARDSRELSRVRSLCLVGRFCTRRNAQGDRQQVRRRACRVVARTAPPAAIPQMMRTGRVG
jgi:Tripartite tricarboxylate transporter family receptor